MRRGNFEGKGRTIVKYRDSADAVCCPKTAETIEMPIGTLSRVGPGNHLPAGNAHWRHTANTTEPSVYGGDAALRLIIFSLTTTLYQNQCVISATVHSAGTRRTARRD